MKKIFTLQNSKLILLALFFLVISNYFHSNTLKPSINLSKQDTALNVDNDILKIFSIGQNRLIADLFWITTLLESDHDHYKKKDSNSWMFLRFLTITNLDYRFLRNYQFGGMYLSIIKDDLIGAKTIFEKGLKTYPNDYKLILNTAFLYAFELQEFEKAIKLYQKLLKFENAPKFIPSVINKLKYAQSDDIELAYELVKSTLATAEEGTTLHSKLTHDLYAIKATIDLDCLNNNKENCSKIDNDGNPYLYKNGSYTAIKEFKPYKLYLKN